VASNPLERGAGLIIAAHIVFRCLALINDSPQSRSIAYFIGTHTDGAVKVTASKISWVGPLV